MCDYSAQDHTTFPSEAKLESNDEKKVARGRKLIKYTNDKAPELVFFLRKHIKGSEIDFNQKVEEFVNQENFDEESFETYEALDNSPRKYFRIFNIRELKCDCSNFRNFRTCRHSKFQAGIQAQEPNPKIKTKGKKTVTLCFLKSVN